MLAKLNGKWGRSKIWAGSVFLSEMVQTGIDWRIYSSFYMPRRQCLCLRQKWEQGRQNIPRAYRGPAAPLGVGVRYRMGCSETEFINRSVAIMS